VSFRERSERVVKKRKTSLQEHEEKHAFGGQLPAFAGTSFKKLGKRIGCFLQ